MSSVPQQDRLDCMGCLVNHFASMMHSEVLTILALPRCPLGPASRVLDSKPGMENAQYGGIKGEGDVRKKYLISYMIE